MKKKREVTCLVSTKWQSQDYEPRQADEPGSYCLLFPRTGEGFLALHERAAKTEAPLLRCLAVTSTSLHSSNRSSSNAFVGMIIGLTWVSLTGMRAPGRQGHAYFSQCCISRAQHRTGSYWLLHKYWLNKWTQNWKAVTPQVIMDKLLNLFNILIFKLYTIHPMTFKRWWTKTKCL